MVFSVRTFCVLLAVSASVLAQEAPPIETVFTATPEQLLAQAKAIEAEEDDSVVVLLREFVTRFESDGSGVSISRRIYQIRKEDAVDSWGALSTTWAPWRQARPEIRARVIAPDGTVHELDPATIAEVAGRTAANSIYSDDKKLQAPLPAIEPGSVVEREIVIRRLKPAFDGGTAGKWYFDTSGPVRVARIVIDAAADVPLKYFVQLTDDAGPTVTEANGRKRLVFELRDLPADADQPSNLPSDRARWPAVVYSTGESWQAVATRYGERLEEQLAAGPLEKVDVPEGLSKKELAAALKAKLHEQVRYTGIEFSESAYIPHPPSETMGRRYGDCKDTATVLIGMLRSHGVDATIALLSAGTGRDVDPETPGMGRFNHAIVYVPDDEEPLWIDTTAEFSRVDELPTNDQGRLALIVAPDTTELTLTPVSTSADNRLIKYRNVELPNNGKGALTEIFESYGSIELGYRGSFHGVTSEEDLNDSFDDYAKDEFSSEEIELIEVDPSEDLSSRHRMKIELAEVGQAVSDPKEAVVVIPLAGLRSRLPNALLSDPEDDEEPRTDDFILSNPHTVEFRYRVRPAVGYVFRDDQEDIDRKLGVAHYSAKFAEGEDGVAEAVVRFDSGPRRLTPEQFEETRKALREFAEEDRALMWFDQRGEALMTAGKVGEALTEFRKLQEAEPDEVLHQVRAAMALLGVGLGEPARAEARAATEAAPESATAWIKLGWTLEHDLVGRRFEKGWDAAGAEAAYRKAVELEPEDIEARASIAILLEHAPDGERYGVKARLDEAIDEYRALLEIDDNDVFEQNLLAALMRANRFEELRDELKERKRTDLPYMEIAARAVLESPEDAVEWAGRNVNETARPQQLNNAVQSLMITRNYPQVAGLMRAVAAGSSGGAAALAQAKLFASMQRHEELELPDDDPRSVALKAVALMSSADDLPTALRHLSSHAGRILKSEELQEEMRQELYQSKSQMRASNLPVAFSIDVLFAGRDQPVTGDDQVGHSSAIRVSGEEMPFYVIQEDGEYRLLDLGDGETADFTDAAMEVLTRLDAGRKEGAGVVLDWIREQVPLTTGDDPLSGDLFARSWSVGDERKVPAMRAAAAAMLINEDFMSPKAVEILTPLRKKARSQEEKSTIDQVLLKAHLNLNRFEEAAVIARRLWKTHPKSDIALSGLLLPLAGARAWDELKAAAQARLQGDPRDTMALRALLLSAMARRNLDDAAEVLEKIEQIGSLIPADYGMYAWTAVNAEPFDPTAVDAMEKAVQLSGNEPSGEVLKTLAIVYAENGQTGEARQVQSQAMKAQFLEQPNDAAWYVYGRIAETLGEIETARSYYQRVEKDPDETVQEISMHALAQRRLAKL